MQERSIISRETFNGGGESARPMQGVEKARRLVRVIDREEVVHHGGVTRRSNRAEYRAALRIVSVRVILEPLEGSDRSASN